MIDRPMRTSGGLLTHIDGSVLQESRQAVERESADRFLVDASAVLVVAEPYMHVTSRHGISFG